MLKVSDIRELIRLLDETSVHELKIETEEIKVSIKKADATVTVSAPVSSIPTQVVAAAPISPAPSVTDVQAQANVLSQSQATREPGQEEAGFAYVKSPMVGTFYRSSSPTAAPYVEVGAKVVEKSVVCIVEAMKLMNEIEADVRGEIVEILAENGHLVEYGQPLFKVKTA